MEDVSNDCTFSSSMISDASGIIYNLRSFANLLTAIMFQEIFNRFDPVSRYLQSEKIDLLQAINVVNNLVTNLNQCVTILIQFCK